MTDLSTLHGLISDLFVWPKTQSDWNQYRLSDEQVAHYKEFGYVSGIKILEDWQIERFSGFSRCAVESRFCHGCKPVA